MCSEQTKEGKTGKALRKRSLGSLFAITLALGLMPTAAFAAPSLTDGDSGQLAAALLMAQDVSSAEASEDGSGAQLATNQKTAKSISKAKVTFGKITFTGKTVKPKMTVTLDGKTLALGTDFTVEYKDTKGKKVSAKSLKTAGTYKAIVKGKGAYTGTKTATFKIGKATNPLKVKAHTVKLKQSDVQAQAKSVAAKSACSVSSVKGKVTYKKVGGSSCLSVNSKTGAITVAKGTAAGIYTARIKVSTAGSANFKAASKTATVKVVVTAAAVHVKTATYAFDLPAELTGKVRVVYRNDQYYTVDVYATNLSQSGSTPVLTVIKGMFTIPTQQFSHPAGQNYTMVGHAGLSFAVGYNHRFETSMPATPYSDKSEWVRLHNKCVSSLKSTLEIYRPSNVRR